MRDERKMFPILNDPILKGIPWEFTQPHELQAKHNHCQTLRGLAARGGLDIYETYHVLTNSEWPRNWAGVTIVGAAAYRRGIMRLLHEFERAKTTVTA